MLTIKEYVANYRQVYIYNDDGEILFQTERPYELQFDLNIDKIRNARKLTFAKQDCFEINSSMDCRWGSNNGKDLYIHNSFVDVINTKEKLKFDSHGEKDYKDIYTLKLNCNNGEEIEVESDFYTRTELSPERQMQEKIAAIMTDCLYGNKNVNHYEVEKIMEYLDITIK